MRIIIDAGPLIALVNADDQYHEWAKQHADRHPKPFFTCESVLAEATLRLEEYPGGVLNVMRMLERGTLRLAFDLAEQFQPVKEMMEKYQDIPMSLADACLVRMTEILPDMVIFSTDFHFQIYCRLKREPIKAILPG